MNLQITDSQYCIMNLGFTVSLYGLHSAPYWKHPSSLGISSSRLWREFFYLLHYIEHNHIRGSTITIFEPLLCNMKDKGRKQTHQLCVPRSTSVSGIGKCHWNLVKVWNFWGVKCIHHYSLIRFVNSLISLSIHSLAFSWLRCLSMNHLHSCMLKNWDFYTYRNLHIM